MPARKLAVAALAVLVMTSPALAKKKQKLKRVHNGPDVVYTDRSLPLPDRYSVVQNGKVLGRDPDPNIRFQLWRQGDPALYNDN